MIHRRPNVFGCIFTCKPLTMMVFETFSALPTWPPSHFSPLFTYPFPPSQSQNAITTDRECCDGVFILCPPTIPMDLWVLGECLSSLCGSGRRNGRQTIVMHFDLKMKSIAMILFPSTLLPSPPITIHSFNPHPPPLPTAPPIFVSTLPLHRLPLFKAPLTVVRAWE